MSQLLFNHRRFNSVDNIKKKSLMKLQTVFFPVICHINQGIYRQNKVGKYFLFGMPFLSINSSLIILLMELQTD